MNTNSKTTAHFLSSSSVRQVQDGSHKATLTTVSAGLAFFWTLRGPPYHFQSQQWPVQSFWHHITQTNFSPALCFLSSTWIIQGNLPIVRSAHSNFNSICNFNSPLPCSKHIPTFQGLGLGLWLGVGVGGALSCLLQHSRHSDLEANLENTQSNQLFLIHFWDLCPDWLLFWRTAMFAFALSLETNYTVNQSASK